MPFDDVLDKATSPAGLIASFALRREYATGYHKENSEEPIKWCQSRCVEFFINTSDGLHGHRSPKNADERREYLCLSASSNACSKIQQYLSKKTRISNREGNYPALLRRALSLIWLFIQKNIA